MKSKNKFIWPTLFWIAFVLLCCQIYQTNVMRKECSKLISNTEIIEANYNYQLSVVSFFNKLFEKLYLEHNMHIHKQAMLYLFTFNNFCYLKETSPNDSDLLQLLKEKEYSIEYDYALVLIDCGYYFLFKEDDFIGSIDVWSLNGNWHLDWYLRNHMLFRYE